jgi:hypothetical protein
VEEKVERFASVRKEARVQAGSGVSGVSEPGKQGGHEERMRDGSGRGIDVDCDRFCQATLASCNSGKILQPRLKLVARNLHPIEIRDPAKQGRREGNRQMKGKGGRREEDAGR